MRFLIYQFHFDVLSTKTPELIDGVCVSADQRIICNGKAYTSKAMNHELGFHGNAYEHLSKIVASEEEPELEMCQYLSCEKIESRYLVFDYETVVDFSRSCVATEYSLSVLDVCKYSLEILNEIDKGNWREIDIYCLPDHLEVFVEKLSSKNTQLEALSFFRKTFAITFIGFDCSKKFIEYILEKQKSVAFTFIGFNNSNFDNFILLNALLRFQSDNEYSVGGIFYNGSQLLNFKMSGRHETFDVRKHLVGSLKRNCESFKIGCCAKTSMDHNYMQALHDDGKLMEYLEGPDKEKLIEYNEHDVLATAILFFRYKEALMSIPMMRQSGENLTMHKTIGSMIFKVFSNRASSANIELPKLSYEHYKAISSYKIAGRVELFNGIQDIQEKIASTDVCSLYPYVMAIKDVYYPSGEIVEVDSYQGPDQIGFYYCDIDQSNLAAKNLPMIYARKTEDENQWDYNGVLQDYFISTEMICLLLEFECKVEIKRGIIFSEKVKSCDMFSFVLPLMAEKNKQDELAATDSPDYNPALRECMKLLMNAPSGKVIEGLHLEKTESVETYNDYKEISDKAVNINVINSIGDKVFVTYTVDEEKECAKNQKPIYLGNLIYDYSKAYMYRNSYSKIGKDKLLYTDTDASKMRFTDFLKWKEWIDTENVIVPHWPEIEDVDARYKTHKIYQSDSKVFGSFEDEMQKFNGDSYRFVCVEKKAWMYESYKQGVVGKSKFCFKGINGDSQMIEPEKLGFAAAKGKEKDTYAIIDQKKAHYYAVANEDKKIGKGNVGKFFDQILKTGEAYLLSSSFRKVVKNSNRGVAVGEFEKYNGLNNTIQICHQIKHIDTRESKKELLRESKKKKSEKFDETRSLFFELRKNR